MKIFINGRFLTQKITGVQRLGIEVTKELDKIVEPGEVTILTPPGIINDIQLENIPIIQVGRISNNVWTQVILPMYALAHRGRILTMAGMCPVINPGYFVAHDVTFLRRPESFSKAFRTSYKINYHMTLKRCKQVFTVSNFSKNELIETIGVQDDKITVINSASDHLLNNVCSEQDISKWGIESGNYYLSVSSQNLHKNQEYISKCAQKYPDEKFVIVGSNNIKSFSSIQHKILENEIYTGYVSDQELYALYKKAKGFIFPSLYEGFGLPPLEAITMGVHSVAVSDIPVFREIYPRGVYYFNPNDVNTFDKIAFDAVKITKEDREYYLKRYTFKNVAIKIMEVIRAQRKSDMDV